MSRGWSVVDRRRDANVVPIPELSQMSLEQASYVGQIVGAMAVIASLIFVGVQLKR